MLHLQIKDLYNVSRRFRSISELNRKVTRGLPDIQQLFAEGEAIIAKAFPNLQERYTSEYGREMPFCLS